MQLEACAHPFFDELRETNARLPNGRPLPPLFNFKQEVRILSSFHVKMTKWFEYLVTKRKLFFYLFTCKENQNTPYHQ